MKSGNREQVTEKRSAFRIIPTMVQPSNDGETSSKTTEDDERKKKKLGRGKET